MNPILYAIPVFFLLLSAEWWLAKRKGLPTFFLADSITSISLGTMSTITGLVLQIGIYTAVYTHWRWFTLSTNSWWLWLSALLAYDFFYYWAHRFDHEISVLWAGHAVHHSSEFYNLSTALRQPSTGFLLGWIFYIPMALLGVSPSIIAAVSLTNLLYQYWVHTEVIGKLGWFDGIFVSPSNHRVHHAVNDCYLDKNYAGIFIFWDRLFGSYAVEFDEHPVVYGTRTALSSFNPFWANFEHYASLIKDTCSAKSWLDKGRMWLKPPGWRPHELQVRAPKPAFSLQNRQRYLPQTQRSWLVYASIQSVINIVLASHCIAVADTISRLNLWLYIAWLCLSLWSTTGLLENKRGFLSAEIIRYAGLILMLHLGYGLFSVPLNATVELGILSIAYASVLAAFGMTRQVARAIPSNSAPA